jgi:O-succinylhomoserine sulfhydrylase
MLKGLETLAVRVERQTRSAGTVADALSGHSKLSRLIYCGRPDHRRRTSSKSR